MMDILAAASIQAAMRQDFPDRFADYIVRERRHRRLALHEAFSLYLSRWQRPPRDQHLGYPTMTPPL
jgi:hypothetical protein